MARLPNPGGDENTWGTLLNTFLEVEHNPDGTLKQSTAITQAGLNASAALAAANAKYVKPAGGIPEADLSTAVQAKLDATGTAITATSITDSTAVGRSVITATDAAAARSAIGAGTSTLTLGTTASTAKAGNYTPTKSDVGLSNVDNTSDAGKPISTAIQTALNLKRDASSHDTLNDLTDVTTTGATDGQSLVYTAGTWAPATVASGTGPSNGPQFFVQATDPGNAASDGDIWIDTSL
jgi:hypothetical protein